jgi:hypothetical protein
MMAHEDTDIPGELLLRYVGLLAERHACRPDEGFEFQLWEELLRDHHELVSCEECQELTSLVWRTQCWVSDDFASGRLQLLAVEDWMALLATRAHEEEIDEGGRAPAPAVSRHA